MTLVGGAALLGLGFLIGCFGTLIGAGGGFLLVPLLLLGYHFSPPTAVGTSLALVFLNAASGSVAYLRQRRVDLGLGWKRSEEHTSELQSRSDLVCRLLLEKKKEHHTI